MGFNLIEFSEYKTIKGQYSDDFIRTCLAVKTYEGDDWVCVVVSKGAGSDTEEIIRGYHSGKKVNIQKEEAEVFAEFIAKNIERADDEKDDFQEEDENISEVSRTEKIINIVNGICLSALRLKASDIHIHKVNNKTQVRYRVDGVLSYKEEYSALWHERIISRIRVMAALDIGECDRIQEGRIKPVLKDGYFDARVSVIPSLNGSVVVMRLFESNAKVLSIKELGFTKDVRCALTKTLNLKSGLVLATGPTGCGKTTTLHSVLNLLDKDGLKIISIEDPIERVIEGVDQIQVNEKKGLTFSKILTGVLRQDPDVIMIGEIRDSETASLAVRASLTGHLVLSTLHTQSAVSAITRMRDLGIEGYLLSSVLKGCLSQRLIRRRDKKEKGKREYKGRVAVGEMFMVSRDIELMIRENKSEGEIEDYLKSIGYKTLEENAKEYRTGISDEEELKRVGLL